MLIVPNCNENQKWNIYFSVIILMYLLSFEAKNLS